MSCLQVYDVQSEGKKALTALLTVASVFRSLPLTSTLRPCATRSSCTRFEFRAWNFDVQRRPPSGSRSNDDAAIAYRDQARLETLLNSLCTTPSLPCQTSSSILGPASRLRPSRRHAAPCNLCALPTTFASLQPLNSHSHHGSRRRPSW